ncbi:hypothetical protein [Mycobacterium montefiorense]|uniref:hypothetical protein n=1 Tax=Mycobacterium montefiorense TaxID=154654 RepID=UPI000D59A9D1|nr:hypothetical protein [Mycobacterium montefiorense]
MSTAGGDEVFDRSLTCAGGSYFARVSAALRAPSLSDAVSRSAFAPVTSTHWLMSSVVDGAASVVSLDGDPVVTGAEAELFLVDPGELVALLAEEQPDIANPATSIAATNQRWVM